jgi:hypothetical protein
MTPFPDLNSYKTPDRSAMDWIKSQGVSTNALTTPIGFWQTKGTRANDGYFEEENEGQQWLIFPQNGDTIFWQPETNQYATWSGHAFALWEHVIWNVGTYAFDHALNIYANPIDWLLNKRDGIVVFNWDRAYYSLRDCPRISLPESLIETYEQAMKPARPAVFVRPEIKEAAE